MTTLSAYEVARLEKLQRNRNLLQSTGVTETVAEWNKEDKRKKKKKKTSNTSNNKKSTIPDTLKRRSPRFIEGSSEDVHKSLKVNDDEEEEEDNEFDMSQVSMYSCYDDHNKKKHHKDDMVKKRMTIKASEELGDRKDPDLKYVYTMSFHTSKPILAAGGHQGGISLFNITEEQEPILSFKGNHGGGWISTVQFLESNTSRLMSTSSSGEISIWNCDKLNTKSGRAQLLAKHTVRKGETIYSGDYCETTQQIITSTRDGALSLVQLNENDMSLIREFPKAHEGTAKSVMFQPDDHGNIIGSGGNDYFVKLFDLRVDKKSTKSVVSLEASNPSPINVIRWNPQDSNMIISASYSPVIDLFDIRKPSLPTMSLKGHIPKGVTRCRYVYNPIFVNGGENIVACGANAKALAMFSSKNGDILSRGHVGYNVSNMEISPCGKTIALTHSGKISFFSLF